MSEHVCCLIFCGNCDALKFLGCIESSKEQHLFSIICCSIRVSTFI